MKHIKLLIFLVFMNILPLLGSAQLPVASSNPNAALQKAAHQSAAANAAANNQTMQIQEAARQAIFLALYDATDSFMRQGAAMRKRNKIFTDQYGDQYAALFNNLAKQIMASNEKIKKIKHDSEIAQKINIPIQQASAFIEENAVEDFFHWMQAQPKYINSLVDYTLAVPVLLYVIKNIDTINPLYKQFFDYLLKMNVNLEAKDALGNGALYYAINLNPHNDDEIHQVIRLIVSRMLEQKTDPEELYNEVNQWLTIQKQELAQEEKEDKQAKERNESFAELVLPPIRNKIIKAEMLLNLLKDEVVMRKEMEQGRKELLELGALPRDVVSLIAPSKKRYLARIKNAIQDNDSKGLEEALESDKYLEASDEIGYTPLLYAVYINQPDMVKLLIQHGANIQAETKDGMNAEHLADDVMKKIIITARLQREEAQVKKEATAKKESEEKKSKLSLENAEQLKNLFNAIVEKDPVAVAQYALPEIINTKNSDYLTPLMMAVKYGDVDILKELLNNGADTTAQGKLGSTALMLAIEQKKYGIAAAIADRMNQKELGIKNSAGLTALELALKDKEEQKDNEEYQDLIEYGFR